MSPQGPLIVVADRTGGGIDSAPECRRRFPHRRKHVAKAPTAFVAVKPAALVIAEPRHPTNETSSRMLCLQIATAAGPIVPVVAVTEPDGEPTLPIALPASSQHERLIARLQSALRVRALHAAVLRRYEAFFGEPPRAPSGDALEDATVLVAWRGPLYPAAQHGDGRAGQDDRSAQHRERSEKPESARHRRRGRR